MKYRIKNIGDGDYFQPQYKPWWSPFWIDMDCCDYGAMRESPPETLECAKNHILKHKTNKPSEKYYYL